MNEEYPSDEALLVLEDWGPDPSTYLELMELVTELWDETYGNLEETPAGRFVLITGGWSGNEDIIAALQENVVFWSLCWMESHRGGRVVLEIPEWAMPYGTKRIEA